MKKILIYIFLSFIILCSRAQNVPNGGFEDWNTSLLFEEPTMWNTSNYQAIYSQMINADKTTDKYNGRFALHLSSTYINSETTFGYALCNATVLDSSSADTIYFEGGFPITTSPDSVYGFFKYSINKSDSALILVSFKKNGHIISQNLFFLKGSQDTYIKIGFDLADIPETPDTATIGFAATNPSEPIYGNSIYVDSVWFTGMDTIPNSNFENWDALSYKDPVNWMSSNLLQAFAGFSESATQTADAHSGNSAIRIESKKTLIPGQMGLDTAIAGFLILHNPEDRFGSNSYFKVDFNPGKLQGYYKLIPGKFDSGIIMINFYDNEGMFYNVNHILPPANSYTYFSIPFDYRAGVTIDSLSIQILTTINVDENNNPQGEEGTLLYLDDLELTNPCEGYPEFSIVNTSTDICSPQTLSAGNDWDEYFWSTSETTPEIEVEYSDTYGVVVTDNSTGCVLFDTIKANIALCDAVNVTPMPEAITIFPSPATYQISIKIGNASQDIYKIEIVSITGQILKSISNSEFTSDETISLSLEGITPGLYFIRMKGNENSYLEKFVIE
jgi:hypothetical protein